MKVFKDGPHSFPEDYKEKKKWGQRCKKQCAA